MSALKKTIISINIFYFLKNNLLVFFFNYNHMSIEEWRFLKNQFSKLNKVHTLVVKNKIGNRVVKEYSEKNTKLPFSQDTKKGETLEKVYTLFQGPTFLIGINSPEQSKQIFSILKQQKKLLFVGGLYQNKQINHLDLDHLLQLEKTVYTSLINTVQSSEYLSLLNTHKNSLYYLLKCYQNNKSLKP